MSDTLRVIVAGTGNMGAAHARAYHKMQGFELCGLVAPTAARRDKLAAQLGNVPQFDSLKTALQENTADAVAVCTYPDTHKELCLQSLEAGAHVFVEKPLAETVADARQIISLAEKKNKKVVVGYILRHHPVWKQFIELAHTLGKPLVMRMNLNQQSSGEKWETHRKLMASMSPVVDCGVHYVDVMCQMTRSKPIQVQAIGARLSAEIDQDMYNYGQVLQVLFEDKSVGWYESGWGPMMSEVAYFVKDVIGPGGSVSIVEPQEASSDIDGHTKTNRLILHKSITDDTGEFLEADTHFDNSDEPDHQGLCDLEQDFFLKSIRDDLDLTDHLNDAVNSLRIVLAADKSVRTGKTIRL